MNGKINWRIKIHLNTVVMMRMIINPVMLLVDRCLQVSVKITCLHSG